MDRLLAVVRRLRAGHLDARVGALAGRDELGVLGRELDSMAVSLERLTRDHRLMLEGAADGIVALEPDGLVRFANPAAEKLLGGHLPGRSLHAVLHGDAHPPAECSLLAPMREGEPRHGSEEAVGPERVAIHWNASVIRDRAVVLGVGVILQDVTGQQKLEKQLRQAQKMEAVGQLAGGVAHDFNNMLAVILSLASLLRDDLPEGSGARADAEEILSAARRGADVTRRLLAFSRSEPASDAPTDLRELAHDVGKLIGRLLGEHIDLLLHVEPGTGRARIARGHLEQAIVNLAVNARDAMPRGGRITIEARRVVLDAEGAGDIGAGEWILLAVTDTGTGMDEATAARVFEPFFTTKEAGSGTGLGLSVVYGTVRAAGGDVRVYSTPGTGTTFKLYLPPHEKEARAEDPAGVPEVRGGHETILLVEDETAVREAAARILRRHGYQVVEAGTSEEALGILELEASRFDLVVSDVVMPGMGGRALFEVMQRRWPRVALLHVSGYPDRAALRHAAIDPAVPYLQKPFTPESLARKVRDVLDSAPAARIA